MVLNLLEEEQSKNLLCNLLNMPLCEVEHTISLTTDEKCQLAQFITQIHSQIFTTPSLFVSTRFTDISGQDVYIGGQNASSDVLYPTVPPY